MPYLGATSLVKTTKDIFQRSDRGGHYRQLSLESLVARLANFETSEPHDIVHSLLAMARDTQPVVELPDDLPDLLKISQRQRTLLKKIASYMPNPLKTRYKVDYKSPVRDVYQEFVAHCIRHADPARALAIIVRPFARTYTRAQEFSFDAEALKKLTAKQKKEQVRLPSWIPDVRNYHSRCELQGT